MARSGDPHLFTRAWLPARPVRALLLIHGFAEHSGRYEHVGEWFAARGCAVQAYDQRGHGRSHGVRGHVRRFDDFLDDLELMLERTRGAFPDLPLFAVGHSMGGLVLAALLRQRRPALAGAVVSGAPLAVRGGAGRLFGMRLLSWILPRLHFESRLSAQGLSRDPEVVKRYLEDPLVFSKLTASLAGELSAAIRRTAPGGADVATPLYMVHGEADPLCPVADARKFHAGVDSPGSAFVGYPDLLHEVFNEPERERVFRDVLEWMEAAHAAGQ